jgi:hypothetical protein
MSVLYSKSEFNKTYQYSKSEFSKKHQNKERVQYEILGLYSKVQKERVQ